MHVGRCDGKHCGWLCRLPLAAGARQACPLQQQCGAAPPDPQPQPRLPCARVGRGDAQRQEPACNGARTERAARRSAGIESKSACIVLRARAPVCIRGSTRKARRERTLLSALAVRCTEHRYTAPSMRRYYFCTTFAVPCIPHRHAPQATGGWPLLHKFLSRCIT
jgi:hypothetical protein